MWRWSRRGHNGDQRERPVALNGRDRLVQAPSRKVRTQDRPANPRDKREEIRSARHIPTSMLRQPRLLSPPRGSIGSQVLAPAPLRFSEEELSRRMRRERYRLACCQDLLVHHFGSRSVATRPTESVAARPGAW